MSGDDRTDPTHSGLGMAMAKEIVDAHGGAIWVTNKSGEKGVKFLMLFDPSGEGKLREELPDLFQTDTIPVELLEGIDKQLDEPINTP